jgi:hypothetical protein
MQPENARLYHCQLMSGTQTGQSQPLSVAAISHLQQQKPVTHAWMTSMVTLHDMHCIAIVHIVTTT